MSLRFESKAILEDNEEKPIQKPSHSETATTSSAYVPPIWQQLQANQDAFQDSYDETTREKFRGTKLLDEEDVEYLSSLDDARMELEERIKREEQDQLHFFRLERERKLQLEYTQNQQLDDKDDTREKNIGQQQSSLIQIDVALLKRPMAPIIAIRKVKRKVQDTKDKETEQSSCSTQIGTNALSSLVGCYESDESD